MLRPPRCSLCFQLWDSILCWLSPILITVFQKSKTVTRRRVSSDLILILWLYFVLTRKHGLTSAAYPKGVCLYSLRWVHSELTFNPTEENLCPTKCFSVCWRHHAKKVDLKTFAWKGITESFNQDKEKIRSAFQESYSAGNEQARQMDSILVCSHEAS